MIMMMVFWSFAFFLVGFTSGEESASSDIVWGAPISAAEMERGRAIPEERPSDVTMALLHEGLQQERRAARNRKSKIQKRSIKAGLSYRWPNGRVPYKIESVFSSSDRDKIASGFSKIMDTTCIEFVDATSADEDWVEIHSTGTDGKCFSEVGFKGPGYGRHSLGLSLEAGCLSVVVHELMHMLGAIHEHTRPDRDNYLFINWPNIELKKAPNMFKYSWDTEDVDSLKRCSIEGQSQSNAYFGDCVSGGTITDVGVGYDYKSIMHYRWNTWAVDGNRCTLCPKNSSIGFDDVGSYKLTAMDIKKLNYAYHCDGNNKVKCGGSYYSATGGQIDGNPLPGFSSCEFLFSTDDGKGIELNLNTTFVGSCSDDYLEVRLGGSKGFLIGKYCKGNEIPQLKKISTASVWMIWKKSSFKSSMDGSWKTYSMSCCNTIVFDILERRDLSGTWNLVNGVESGGRNVYSNGKGKYMSWDRQWKVSSTYPASSISARNQNNFNCPSDLKSGWEGFVGEWVLSSEGAARCSDCDLYPQYEECALCCDKVTATTENSYVSQKVGFILGDYSLYSTTPEINGKKVYSLDDNPDMCIWARQSGSWIIGYCSDLGTRNGFGFGDSAKCIQQSSGWKLWINDNDNTWQFTCADPMKPNQVP